METEVRRKLPTRARPILAAFIFFLTAATASGPRAQDRATLPEDILTEPAAAAEPVPSTEPTAPSAEQIMATTTTTLPAPEDAYYEARRLAAEDRNPAVFSDSLLRRTEADKPAPVRLPALSRRIIELAGIAFEGTEGLLKKEAGRLLVGRLSLEPEPAECLAAAEKFRSAFGPDWEVARSVLDLMVRRGDESQILGAVAELRKTDPKRAESEADFLAWTEIYAKFRSGQPDWTAPARSYILQRTTTAWGLRILDLAATADPDFQDITAREAAVAAMRAAVYRKNNADAFTAIQAFLPELLIPETNPALLSDIGKACLSSTSPAELIPAFAQLEDSASRAASAEKKAGRYFAGIARTGWLAGFYRARLLAASGSPDEKNEAAAAFRRLAETAGNSGDVDSALWYWLDAAIKAARASISAPEAVTGTPAVANTVDPVSSVGTAPDGDRVQDPPLPQKTEKDVRREILAAILEASSLWKSPSWYEDIVDPFFREVVVARDWELLVDMTRSLVGKITSAMTNRLRYVVGRTLETGLALPRMDAPDMEPQDAAARQSEAMYRAILADPDAALYYRALAGWRLGLDLDLIPADGDTGGQTVSRTELEAFIAGFCERGLYDLAGMEAVARAKNLANAQIERIASTLSAKGNVIDSVRLARVLVDRKDRTPNRPDYRLLYPRPWYEIVQSLLVDSGVPEPVFYGLIRSESLFSPTAVSRSGAVGLTQLMPPTAEETARRLKMPSYRITDPADNLYIGFKYYRSMVIMNNDKLMRGMFAYNAGPTRMKRWAAAYPELPDDIVLEILEYAETRQYGRNITQAALMYGALYAGWTSRQTLDLIVDGKKG